MANYPASLDNGITLPNPAGTSTQASPDHASLHTTENTAIIALETKLGTGSSTPSSTNLLVSTGTGTSAWTKASPTGAIVGTTDSQTLTNKILTSPTVNTPTITNASITADALTGFSTANTGTVYGVSVTAGIVASAALLNTVNTAAIQAGAVTGSKIANYNTTRQDNTTNSTETTARILTGWGVITPGVTNVATEAVTFNSAFVNLPIVTIICGGDNASSTTYGSGGNNLQGAVVSKAHTITTTGFTAYMSAPGNWAAGNTVFYQWIAIGA